MASLLARLADAASRRRRLVIGAWLALLVGGAWFSLHQSDRLSGGGWDVPGSASVRVSDELDAFPDFSSPALSVLVTGRSPAAVQKRLAAVRATAARDPALRPNRRRLFAHGQAALLPVTYVGPTGAAIDVATRVRHALVQTSPETKTRVIGQPAIWSNFQEVSKHQLARGEATRSSSSSCSARSARSSPRSRRSPSASPPSSSPAPRSTGSRTRSRCRSTSRTWRR